MQKRYILNVLVDERCHNKRREFISRCRHQNKLLFKNVKYSIDWFSVFHIILFYENFSFSFRTSRNVPQMNVQYKKLGVVYSTNIAFRKPIYHIEHFITLYMWQQQKLQHLYIYIYALCLACWALFGSLVPALCDRTSCAQVHELLQSHCGDNREGTLFSWYAHLASVRFEHSACCGSLMTTYIMLLA